MPAHPQYIARSRKLDIWKNANFANISSDEGNSCAYSAPVSCSQNSSLLSLGALNAPICLRGPVPMPLHCFGPVRPPAPYCSMIAHFRSRSYPFPGRDPKDDYLGPTHSFCWCASLPALYLFYTQCMTPVVMGEPICVKYPTHILHPTSYSFQIFGVDIVKKNKIFLRQMYYIFIYLLIL